MDYLFKNALLLNPGEGQARRADVAVKDGLVAGVTQPGTQTADAAGRETIDCADMLMIPALYNAHTHLPMSLFKGISDDLPLDRWLFEKIFPAEDKLNSEMCYWASLLSLAECAQNGVVSCSDMYWFYDGILRAVDESGMKINASRAVQSFDENEDMARNHRLAEGRALYENWHGACDGRIRVDMSLHAEYTSNPRCAAAVIDYAAAHGAGLHVHLSETKSEHEGCIARHGMTPAAYFGSLGLFELHAGLAHGVWLEDSDIELLRGRDVTVMHCPASNMKLASGAAPVTKLLAAGVNVAIGTDGSASNNRLDVLRELELCSLLQRVTNLDSALMPPSSLLGLATRGAARWQGRPDCGSIAPGMRADITLLDLASIEGCPMYDDNTAGALAYSLNSRNVAYTMCDGRMIYARGEHKTIDVERVRREVGVILERVRG